MLRREFERARRAAGRLDVQTTTVLLSAALLVIVQIKFGDRDIFREHFADAFETPLRELLPWAWWFGMQGILGFVIPVAILLGVFKRRASEVGLGLGDWKLGLGIMAAYLPLVVVGTWFLSAGDGFLAQYPHHAPAARDWTIFLIYEAFFLLYWVGWEYLWRGYVLFGTRHTFGVHAIIVQALPFAVLHFTKPFAEAFLSIIGAVALGALVWRCRSFWIAVPIHAAQMMILDFWCAMRVRTGVRGVGFDALGQLLSGG
ncbi:MAG: CPBP family intramembrane metalloprotease [Rhodothermales bacterium]|nr:CPBP family intramembrane metalloprotease [Rhodothermales bacterium]MBO6780401.1 CPBP family intramembrane metalloprotease [Rhodothermales bacterium]